MEDEDDYEPQSNFDGSSEMIGADMRTSSAFMR